jgi:hypothetical protein
MRDIWCFPFSSEGKARRCARALIDKGSDDIALKQRAGCGTSQHQLTAHTCMNAFLAHREGTFRNAGDGVCGGTEARTTPDKMCVGGGAARACARGSTARMAHPAGQLAIRKVACNPKKRKNRVSFATGA